MVILDLTIPNSPGGEETVKRLNELNPNVKSIVSSGYSHGSVMANYKAHGLGDEMHVLWSKAMKGLS